MAVAIIFTACISILCLIFVPKILATKKPRVEKRRYAVGGPQISRTSQSNGGAESETVGIKILSSPAAIAQLEEENRRLKQFVIDSGRRLSHMSNASMAESDAVVEREKRLSSVLHDEEAGSGSRRLSQLSNGSMAESDDVVVEREKLVTFESSNKDGIK